MGTAPIARPAAGRPLVDLARALGLAAAYFAAGTLALRLAIPPGYATAVWPAAGIALASVLLFGPRMALGVWLGSFATNVVASFDPTHAPRSLAVAGAIAFGAALEAWAGSALIRRTLG